MNIEQQRIRISEMVRDGTLENIKNFLNQNLNFDINFENFHNDTLLDIAVTYGHSEIVRFLVEKGLRTNNKSSDSNEFDTPVHHWMMLDESKDVLHDILKTLVNAGADINAIGKFKGTPMHLGCSFGRIENVLILLEYRPDASIRDCNHMTPLDILHYDVYCNPENNIWRFGEKISMISLLRSYENKIAREQLIFCVWPIFTKKMNKDLIGKFSDFVY